MTDCLIYWKDFWLDIDVEPNAVNYHWHDSRRHLFNHLASDSSLWIVVSGGVDYPGEWRLLERIVVQDLKFEAKYNYVGGRPYHVIGNNKKSQQFEIDAQPDFSAVLHKLEFTSGKRIILNGASIGLALQQIRPLTSADSILLKQYARKLTDRSLELEGVEELIEKSLKVGAGFGNSETNQKVWRASTSFVTKWYESRGWKVQCVEFEYRGYDLVCMKGSVEEHVEVKGIRGDLISFFITAREVQKAQSDSNFVICAVTSALSDSPKLSRYVGKKFIADFNLAPILYRASLRK